MAHGSLAFAILPALIPAWIWMWMAAQQKAISFTTESWSTHYDYIVGQFYTLKRQTFLVQRL